MLSSVPSHYRRSSSSSSSRFSRLFRRKPVRASLVPDFSTPAEKRTTESPLPTFGLPAMQPRTAVVEHSAPLSPSKGAPKVVVDLHSTFSTDIESLKLSRTSTIFSLRAIRKRLLPSSSSSIASDDSGPVALVDWPSPSRGTITLKHRRLSLRDKVAREFRRLHNADDEALLAPAPIILTAPPEMPASLVVEREYPPLPTSPTGRSSSRNYYVSWMPGAHTESITSDSSASDLDDSFVGDGTSTLSTDSRVSGGLILRRFRTFDWAPKRTTVEERESKARRRSVALWLEELAESRREAAVAC
ncbi:hypothetical protein JCM10450v2_004459 [Rhodotorula kratochvilovae]